MKALVWLSMATFVWGAAGEGDKKPDSKAAPAFEKLKTLVGKWEAKDEDGSVTTIEYRVVSGGSCLMEILGHGEGEDMVTMYHLDGDHLMMTHYCSANNQPRMRAEPFSKDDATMTFTFMDATNMASPDEGHMHGLAVTFEDKDHFTQKWTFRQEGKDGHVTNFKFARKSENAAPAKVERLR